MVTVGVDWAEAHHDVAIHDPQGRPLRTGRIDTGPAGFSQLLAMIADCGATPETTAVAVETDKNLLVVALQGAGFEVFAINPRAVARYRERVGQAGAKSDARDAAILADILRTDRHLHRVLPHPSEQARAVKALARQHQEAIWALHQTLSRLRSLLLEFYPAAVTTFPQLKHHTALAVLAAAPTPAQGRQLTRRQVVAILHRVGRRNDRWAGRPDHRRAARPGAGPTAAGRGRPGRLRRRPGRGRPNHDRRHRGPRSPARGRVRRPPVGAGAALGARPGTRPGRPSPRRDRRRPHPVRHHREPALVRRHSPRHPRLRQSTLGPSPPRPQQTPRRRLPLVGLRRPHPAPEPTTTAAEPPATTTTPPCDTSPTPCSAKSGTAYNTNKPGTNNKHGPPAPTSQPPPLDT